MKNINKNDLKFLPQFDYNPYSYNNEKTIPKDPMGIENALSQQIKITQSNELSHEEDYVDTDNRIGRLRYLRSLLANQLIFLLTAFFIIIAILSESSIYDSASGYLILSAIYPCWRILWQTRKRLHDINLTGWHTLWVLVPYLNFLFIVYLIFKSGDENKNDYGLPSKPNPELDLTIIICVIGACIFSWSVLNEYIRPYSDDYEYYDSYYSDPAY
ncbi:Inner membrane protein yhaH [Moraxella lacunata]|uniref:Inner membrane protein yhaH n=1 Tax=Moraxella lacunata TaxID=477 RepID=A0A378TAC3_MORLA|nr:DUF805 domain-containing protein [Moraxella lacunata]STZ56486.1 Inner membrane protein yhaH [Moraxella lacunata]